jgi:nucleoid-associated protein YgaU
MGMFDFLKKDKAKSTDTVTPPSVVLRNAGIDPSALTFKFSGTGVTIGGHAASEAERKRIVELVSAIPQLQSVDDQIKIASAEADTATAGASTQAVGGAAAASAVTHGDQGEANSEATSHTVVSGDTLWKIAQQHYGKGSDYMKIFEANRDLLDDPDKIKVGQVLKIPPQ